jgi:PBP1b-binding outer membrane lipoprotein LpoB
MRQAAKTLLILLTALVINGCSNKQQPEQPVTDQFVSIQQKCIPDIPAQPEIYYQTFQAGQEELIVKWLWGEVLKFKEDGEKVRAEVKKCQ